MTIVETDGVWQAHVMILGQRLTGSPAGTSEAAAKSLRREVQSRARMLKVHAETSHKRMQAMHEWLKVYGGVPDETDLAVPGGDGGSPLG